MKIVFVVPYFGKLPNYFQLFLGSCSYNKGFEWLIFTDDNSNYHYPENVHKVDMTFLECKKLIQSKFDFTVSLDSPQKLCDYKCAYGYIFNKYIENYDFWGHCDLDQIFGDLSKFYTEEIFRKYDKIGSLGHLTLYRNTENNNQIFKSLLNGKERYKEVFTTKNGCAFDEWLPENINEIFLKSNSPVLLENYGADVNPYKTVFTLLRYDLTEKRYISEEISNSIFIVKNGALFRKYELNYEIVYDEFPYVHLQKRKMNDKRIKSGKENYAIIPNSFVDSTNCSKLLKKCKKLKVLNYQFFKVKINSLKYRIKNKDWQFSNVLK